VIELEQFQRVIGGFEGALIRNVFRQQGDKQIAVFLVATACAAKSGISSDL
jgi:hypothetical protein